MQLFLFPPHSLFLVLAIAIVGTKDIDKAVEKIKGRFIKVWAWPVNCPNRALASILLNPTFSSLLNTKKASMEFIIGTMAAPMVMGIAIINKSLIIFSTVSSSPILFSNSLPISFRFENIL